MKSTKTAIRWWSSARRAFRQAKPFNLGSHANKVMFGVNNTILVIVDSPKARNLRAGIAVVVFVAR